MRRCLVCLTLLALLLLNARVALAEEAPPRQCTVEPRAGIALEDAEAIEEIVCAEIRSKAADRGPFRVRVARLGGKVVLTLIAEGVEKQLVLSGLDEVPVAAPRLVDAIIERKTVTETQTVTNIVGIEARIPKKKASAFHVELGTVIAGTLVGDVGGGANFAMTVGSDRWSFVSDLRLAGYAFDAPLGVALGIFSLGGVELEPDDDAFSYASLSGGFRHHFSPRDTALFAGVGVAYEYLKADKHSRGNGGPAAYAEVGVDILRTHAVGGLVAARLDAPAFEVDGSSHAANWSPIGSLNLSFRF